MTACMAMGPMRDSSLCASVLATPSIFSHKRSLMKSWLPIGGIRRKFFGISPFSLMLFDQKFEISSCVSVIGDVLWDEDTQNQFLSLAILAYVQCRANSETLSQMWYVWVWDLSKPRSHCSDTKAFDSLSPQSYFFNQLHLSISCVHKLIVTVTEPSAWLRPVGARDELDDLVYGVDTRLCSTRSCDSDTMLQWQLVPSWR